MFRSFISLEWKNYFRSPAFSKKLVLKILLIFFALIFIVEFLALGAAVFYILKKAFPDQDPFITVNNMLIYWFLFDLVFRFFMQKLPVMNIKPFMVLPVPKKKVIHYLMSKSLLSFFNILPLFFFVPFTIVLLFEGYTVGSVLGWFLAMLSITVSINFINFLINKHQPYFVILVILLGILGGLQYFEFYPVTKIVGTFFYAFYNSAFSIVIPILISGILYRLNYNYLHNNFYIDGVISQKVTVANSNEMAWLNRFGNVAPFLKNDLKMISRNARPKQVVLISILFLFYGLIFFTQDIYMNMPAILAFASIFVTGGFLMTFGQHVPSWDSEYYKLMMSQNIKYKLYLESKWMMLVVGTLLSFLLSIPYLYFGVKIFGMIAAGAMFNIGVNSILVLWGGALNRHRLN